MLPPGGIYPARISLKSFVGGYGEKFAIQPPTNSLIKINPTNTDSSKMDLRTFNMYSVPGMAEPPASLQRGDSLPYLVPPKPERQRSLSPTLSNFDEIKSLIDRNHTEDPSLKYKGQGLTLVVVGASGDLAKKKTYPSLFQLFKLNYLPENVSITGYARSSYTNTSFRDKIRPFLTGKVDDSKVEEFLAKCEYCQGTGYDDLDSWELLQAKLNNLEREQSTFGWNRIFYFAIPPPQFAPSARAIKAKAMTPNGWNISC